MPPPSGSTARPAPVVHPMRGMTSSTVMSVRCPGENLVRSGGLAALILPEKLRQEAEANRDQDEHDRDRVDFRGEPQPHSAVDLNRQRGGVSDQEQGRVEVVEGEEKGHSTS